MDAYSQTEKWVTPGLDRALQNSKFISSVNYYKTKAMRLSEENIRVTLQDIGMGKKKTGYDPKSTSNIAKNGQMGLHQTNKLLCSKGNN